MFTSVVVNLLRLCPILKVLELNKIKDIIILNSIGASAEMTTKLKQALQIYLEQQNRINAKLQLCVYLLQDQKYGVQELRKRSRKIHEPLKIFRLLILIHTCYLKRMLDPEATVELLSTIKSQSRPKSKNRLDQIINNQVITKYVLYLQKCHQCLIQPIIQQSMDASQRLFCALNLLKIGLSFVDILYTFGRYFRNHHLFIIDFNLVIAADFAHLYEKKIKVILKTNRALWNEQMMLEMERIHQQMYIVYYNCYFYKEIKNLIPRFIETENMSVNPEKSSHSLSKRNRSQLFQECKNKNSSNMSLSSVLGSSSKLKTRETSSFSLTKSTLMTTKQPSCAYGSSPSSTHHSRFPKFDIVNASKNTINQDEYVSEFTSDISDKKDEFAIDDEQGDNNPFKLIQCLERVIAAIDENSEKVQNEKVNKVQIQAL